MTNIFYAAFIECPHYGWHPIEVWTKGEVPTTTEGRMLMAAQCAAEEVSRHDDPGLETWRRWRVFEVHMDAPFRDRDVTSQCVQALVDRARMERQAYDLPAWWSEYARLDPQEMDTWKNEGEDWSPVTLQRELGTY